MMPKGKAREVSIVEGGHCSDTRYLAKLAEREAQHTALKNCGHNVNVLAMAYITGFEGSTYTSKGNEGPGHPI